MKIAITGINGFIGGCLANHFVKEGHQVSGIGRQNALASFVNPKCEYMQADITKKLSILEADVVIHSAGLASDKSPYEKLFLNNVTGTRNVVDASKGVTCFVYVSSSSVYSFTDQPMKENEAGLNRNSLSDYGKTKLLSEELVLEKCKAASLHILRPRAVYGVNDRLILPRLLKLVKGNSIILPAHITKSISLTNIDNFIHAVQLCIGNKTQTKIYNVADERIYSLEETLKQLLSAATGKNLTTTKVPSSLWNGLISLNELVKFNRNLSRFGSDQITKTALMDISSVKAELNYSPKKYMDNSTAEISEWLNQNGGWKKYMNKNLNINS